MVFFIHLDYAGHYSILLYFRSKSFTRGKTIAADKYRAEEEQNGRITLKGEDGVLELTPDDGYRGGEAEKEKIKRIIQKLNKDYGIAFEEADRVVGAIKQKLEKDEALRAAFKTNSIEFLRRQKLQDSIKEAFLSNADEFLIFMSKTETDTGFGKFFFSEMFKWYDQTVSEKPSKLRPETSVGN